MESYGSIITSLTICVGAVHLLFCVISTRIIMQIRDLKKRQMNEKKLIKYKINNYQISQNVRHADFDTNTIDETMSYIDTKA